MNATSIVEAFSESHRGWGSLPQDTIDLILDLLKKTSRWNREGPLLRRLNKHWSRQVDKHIVEAHPHWSRTLKEEDLNSLLKFPNLTSVDLAEFSLWGMGPLTGRRFNGQFNGLVRCITRVISVSKVDSVCKRLEHIPKLRQLKIGSKIEWDTLNKNGKDDVSIIESFRSLTGVRALLFDPHITLFNMKAILSFSSMPIEEITAGLYNPKISDIVNHFPHLKKAKTYLERRNVEEFVLHVQEIEELDMAIDRIPHSVNNSLWHNVKSLKCQIKNINEANFLKNLVNLKELHVNFDDDDDYSDALSSEDMLRALEIVFSFSLTRLTIRGAYGYLRFDDHFASQNKLEDLALDLCEVSGAAILRNFPSIRKLSFQTCSVIDGTQFWEFINQSDTIEGKTLNQICELSIAKVMYDDYQLHWNQGTFLHISKMKSLRKFVLDYDMNIGVSDLEIFAQSSTLRKLEVHNCWWTLRDSQNSGCLEFLSFLDLININFKSQTPFEDLETEARRLKEVAPWIKIEFYASRMVQMHPGGSFNAIRDTKMLCI